MTLLKLVPLGDGPTITFTAAAPVQPGPSHPEDDPAYAGPSRRRSYTGYNFRFLMYKTGTARMARQGMEGKICRAPKARGV